MPNEQYEDSYHLKNALVYAYFTHQLQQHQNFLINDQAQQEFDNYNLKNKLDPSKIYRDIDNLVHSQDLSKQVYVTPKKCNELLEFYLENYQKINYKKQDNGLKLIIDDDGNIIFANWKNKMISGKYFIYLHKLPSQFSNLDVFLNNGICYFGQMKQEKFQGWNYMYGINNIKLAAEWKNNKLNGKCIIKQKNKNKNSMINSLEKEGQQLTFRNFAYQNANYGYIFSQNRLLPNQKVQERQYKQKNIRNAFKSVQLQNIKNHQKNALKIISNCPQANLTVIQFLTKMIEEHQNMLIDQNNSLNYSSQKTQVQKNKEIPIKVKIPIGIKRLTQNQFYIGSLGLSSNQKYESLKNGHDQNLLQINGLGFVLKNDWPHRFGQFKKGKLHGMGKAFQNQLNILDGYFQYDKLKEGFLIDLYNNRMRLGYQSNNQKQNLDQSQQSTILQIKKLQMNNRISPLSPKNKTLQIPINNSEFSIVQTYQSVDFQQISKFRKIIHLKALNLRNDYQTLPFICKTQPWPQFLVRKIYNMDTIKQIIHNFAPQIQNVDISIISGVPQNSDHRVQRNIVNLLNQQQQDQQNLKASTIDSSEVPIFSKRQNLIKIDQLQKSIKNQVKLSQQNKSILFSAQNQRNDLNQIIKQITIHNLAKSKLVESNSKFASIKHQNGLNEGAFYNWISQLQNIQTQRQNLHVKKVNYSHSQQQKHFISQLFMKQKQKCLPNLNKKIKEKTVKKGLDLHQIYSKYLH